MQNKFLTTEEAARLEGISARAMRKRIEKGFYPAWALRKSSTTTGRPSYHISSTILVDKSASIDPPEADRSSPAGQLLLSEESKSKRKIRKDRGETEADKDLLFRCAAFINKLRCSSDKRLKRSYGYKEAYEKLFKPESVASDRKIISYRQFINLTKPFVDKEVQYLTNLGQTKYRQQRMLRHHHDYSIYEPMEFLQQDHSQGDVVCVHDGKIIRPWFSFHLSLGDRILSYPTIVERPDSYSVADDLMNFVLRYGLSRRPVRYYTDNGKAQKSRLMTKKKVFEDVDILPFNLEESHLKAMNLMGIGFMSDKGMIQNLGMIEEHAEARQPQQKLIERNFGIGGTMEWFKDREEYTGRKYEEKPEHFERLVKNGHIWHSDEMIDYVMNKVDEYNNRTHQGIKKECSGRFSVPHTYDLDIDFFQTNQKALSAFAGVVPESMLEVYRIFNDENFAKNELKTNIYSPMWRRKIYELCGWMTRPLPAKETLALMTMKAEERTVHPTGIIINGLRYIDIKLQPFIHKKVVVRYSPSNIVRLEEESGKTRLFIKEVYVFIKRINTTGGRINESEEFICIAEPHPATVKDVVARGRTRTFLNQRSMQFKEVREAGKICTEESESKSQISVVQTPLYQIPNFRDEAGKRLAEAKEEKKAKAKSKKIEEQILEDELAEIYGGTVKIQEGN